MLKNMHTTCFRTRRGKRRYGYSNVGLPRGAEQNIHRLRGPLQVRAAIPMAGGVVAALAKGVRARTALLITPAAHVIRIVTLQHLFECRAQDLLIVVGRFRRHVLKRELALSTANLTRAKSRLRHGVRRMICRERECLDAGREPCSPRENIDGDRQGPVQRSPVQRALGPPALPG
jgi:hypothetical protein